MAAMTLDAKLDMVKDILGIARSDTSLDTRLTTYLDIAKREILAWRYSYATASEVPSDVPEEYEMTQVMAVVTGYNQAGAEGETMHQENSFLHRFSYSDMLNYIRVNVVPLCKVVSV